MPTLGHCVRTSFLSLGTKTASPPLPLGRSPLSRKECLYSSAGGLVAHAWAPSQAFAFRSFLRAQNFAVPGLILVPTASLFRSSGKFIQQHSIKLPETNHAACLRLAALAAHLGRVPTALASMLSFSVKKHQKNTPPLHFPPAHFIWRPSPSSFARAPLGRPCPFFLLFYSLWCSIFLTSGFYTASPALGSPFFYSLYGCSLMGECFFPSPALKIIVRSVVCRPLAAVAQVSPLITLRALPSVRSGGALAVYLYP